MRNLILITMTVLLAVAGRAADTAAVQIAAGRAALVAHDLPTAKANFAAALALEPDNQAAAALLGLARCFAIVSLPESQALLDRAGVTAAGRDVYDWTATFANDEEGRALFADGFNTDEVFAYWRNTVVAESEQARADLALVTDPLFTLTLAPEETRQPAAITLDRGDLLVIRAGLRAAELFAHYCRGQDTRAEVATIAELAAGNLLTLPRVLEENPDLFTPGLASERLAARAAVLDAIALYREASAFLRSRPAGLERLFMLEPEDLAAEAEARETLAKIERSFDGFADYTPGERDPHQLVHLGRAFEAGYSLRAQFPATQSFDPFAPIDLSLGGLLSGLTLERYAEAVVAAGYKADLGWQWVTPTPQGNALTSAAHGNGVYLLAGDAGTFLRSTDAVNWETRQVPRIGGVTGLAFVAGHFVAVGNTGVFCSDDGLEWREQPDQVWNGACLASTEDGLALITGGSGVAISPDGVDWTWCGGVYDPATQQALYYPKALAFGNGVYVAVGNDGTGFSGRVFTSADGANWTLRVSGSASIPIAANAVAFGKGRFVCVGNLDTLLVSPDGLVWTPGRVIGGSASNGFNGIYFDGSRFVATGENGSIVASSDGLSWSALASPTTQHLGRVVGAGGHLWSFGNGGLVLQASGGGAFAATGAVATTGIPRQVAIRRLRALGGKLFAVGDGGQLYVSTDGSTFVAATASGTLSVSDVAEHNGTFVAVGYIPYSSADGLVWTARSYGGSNGQPNTVAYLNDRFVAAGDGGLVFTSSNGVTWTKRAEDILGTGTETCVTGLAYGDGAYLAVGWTWISNVMSTLTIRSDDGVTWNSTSESFGSGKLLDVDYCNGAFRTLTSGGQLWTIPQGQAFWSGSDDLDNWAPGSIHRFGERDVVVQDSFDIYNTPHDPRDRLLVSAGDHAWIRCASPIQSNSPGVYLSQRFRESVPVAWFGNRLYLGGVGAVLRSRPIAEPGAPVLFAQPVDRQAAAGDTVAFSAGVYGEGRLTYQWYRNGALLAGATNPELLFTAVQPEAAGTYRVLVSNGLHSTASADAVLTVTASFAGWRIANFSAAELADPGVSGPLAVLGPDGAANLLKYGLGVPPRAAIPAGAQTITPPAAGTPGEWIFTYRRPAERPDLEYAVESSTNLAAWSGTGLVQERVGVADAAGVETWQARVTTAAPRLFLHLRVTEK